MKTPCLHWLRLVAATIACALLALDAAAQTYPTKPIKAINPWPAGGAADIIA
jgi:tripartite-type tricarboxylate transporter receptor subunit TctC